MRPFDSLNPGEKNAFRSYRLHNQNIPPKPPPQIPPNPPPPISNTLSLISLPANDYGLFLSDEDPKKGIWLEAGKALDYYMLRNGVSDSVTADCYGT